MVITKDLSRLGRDYILTGHYMERYFPEHRVRYISLLDGIDTGVDSTANDITPFRAIMNDMYAKDISKKISSVKHDKQRKGLFIGGKPVYGYKMHPTEKNKIVIDEAVAPVVRRIFGMALSGMSCRQIATRLNEEHIPTPATYAGLPVGKPGPYTGLWSSERISDMLQNETYIGNMVQGRSRKINYKTKKCIRQQPKDWVVVEGTHEPLIDQETFDKVRRLVDSRKHTRSRRFTKAGVCTCHSIKEQVVTQAVVERVREVCRNYLQAEKLLPIAKQEVTKAQAEADHEKEIAALKAKIDSLSAHLDQVYLDKLSGLLDEADFQRVYRKVKADRAALEQRLSQIDRPDFSPERQNDLAKELVERFLATAPTNREVLVSLIERVELTEEKEVILRFRFRELEQKG